MNMPVVHRRGATVDVGTWNGASVSPGRHIRRPNRGQRKYVLGSRNAARRAVLGRKFPITQAKLAELCDKALRASPKVTICPPGQLTDLTKQAHEHGTDHRTHRRCSTQNSATSDTSFEAITIHRP